MENTEKLGKMIKELGNELEKTETPYVVLAESDEQFIFGALLNPTSPEIMILQIFIKVLLDKEEKDRGRMLTHLANILAKEAPELITKVSVPQSPHQIN